jgi:hypothetical protein
MDQRQAVTGIRLLFAAPVGEELQRGEYLGASTRRSDHEGEIVNAEFPALIVDGDGGYDARRFMVRELNWDPETNEVLSFAVDFQLIAATPFPPGSRQSRPYRGTVAFNSHLGLVECAIPDPFVTLGGGTCYDGDWYPPGMRLPDFACATPDPFVALGGGICSKGGWTPREIVSLPPVWGDGCRIPDPFVSLGGGTCVRGDWYPPGMPVPRPAVCTTPDPFVSLGGGTCRNGGWLPPGMDGGGA